MGAGNYLPAREMGDYEMVYVSGQFEDFQYRQLIEDVRDLLTNAFWEENEGGVRCEIIAQSNLLDVCVADNQWSIAVFVVPNHMIIDGYPSEVNLAYHHLPLLAKKVFKGLDRKGYDLHVRAGAWCSGPYQ